MNEKLNVDTGKTEYTPVSVITLFVPDPTRENPTRPVPDPRVPVGYWETRGHARLYPQTCKQPTSAQNMKEIIYLYNRCVSWAYLGCSFTGLNPL